MIEGRDFAGAAIIGKRKRQEDDWGVHVDPPTVEGGAHLLAVLADGMGGAPAGDRASNTVVAAFLNGYMRHAEPARRRLELAAWGANDAVADAVAADSALNGMGATLVAALCFGGRVEWLSVGDSYLYLCRDAQLTRINPLHTYAATLDAMADRGEISRQTALAHPDRPALTSVVMGWPMEQVAQGDVALQRGDVLVLASDGLDTLADDEIVALCEAGAGDAGGDTPARWIADALLNRVDHHARPYQDNATVIVVLPGEHGTG